MNYRGKDKLAEALKKGLLETARPKKDEPVISEELASRLAAYKEPTKETVKDISGVASALTPKRAPWEIVEEKKPAAPIITETKAPQKSLREIASTVRLNKVEEKPLIINESTDSIASILTNQGKRNWRPARKETLEEKVERLESELSMLNEDSQEYLKKIHAGATQKRHDGWSEHVVSHGGKKYRLVTNGVRASMENYRGHVVPHKKVANIVSKLAESVEPLEEFKKGEDIGKPGLNFKKVAAKAAKEYGSKEAGKRVAGAVLQKILHKEEIELNEETEPKHKFNKVLASHGYVYKGSHTEKSLGGRDHDFPAHTYEHPTTGGKVHVWQQKGAPESWHSRNKQKNGIMAPGHGDTKGQLDRHLNRWKEYHGLKEEVERLDELSAQTMTNYDKKAWISKANAHIDRGGADYLDDDKARSRANRTIGKRERGMALAKAMMKKNKGC
jgi:hypothetical protein